MKDSKKSKDKKEPIANLAGAQVSADFDKLGKRARESTKKEIELILGQPITAKAEDITAEVVENFDKEIQAFQTEESGQLFAIDIGGKDITIPVDPQAEYKRELRVRARTTRLLPMAYKIDEKVVMAWRGYVLDRCGSQLGGGPLLEQALREWLPAHGFPIGGK